MDRLILALVIMSLIAISFAALTVFAITDLQTRATTLTDRLYAVERIIEARDAGNTAKTLTIFPPLPYTIYLDAIHIENDDISGPASMRADGE